MMEHPFKCLFGVCVSAMSCLLRYLAHCFISLFVFLLFKNLCAFWITVFYQMCLCKYFLPSVASLFILLTVAFAEQIWLIL